MPFSKLDDKDCLIRKSLNQFRWQEVLDLSAGQVIQQGAKQAVDALLAEARAQRGATAYVKVGVLKGHLVLRIKVGSKHVGTDDIRLVRDFQTPAVEDAIDGRQLSKKGDKPDVSEAWWDEVRKDFADEPLSGAFRDADLARVRLAKSQSLSTYADAVLALERLEARVKALLPRLQNKDDHKTMLLLQEAVSRESERVETHQIAYAEKVEAQHGSVLESLHLNTTVFAESAVSRLEQAVANEDLAKACELVVSTTTAVERDPLRILRGLVTDAVGAWRIHEDDLHLGMFAEDLQQVAVALEGYGRRLEQCTRDLDALMEDQGKEALDEDDTINRKGAEEALRGFQRVAAAIQTHRDGLRVLLTRARALGGDPDEVLKEASAILTRATALRGLVEREGGQVRTSSSRYVAMKLDAGVHADHPINQRQFLPLQNRVMALAAETKALFRQIKSALVTVSTTLPEEHGAALRMSIES